MARSIATRRGTGSCPPPPTHAARVGMVMNAKAMSAAEPSVSLNATEKTAAAGNTAPLGSAGHIPTPQGTGAVPNAGRPSGRGRVASIRLMQRQGLRRKVIRSRHRRPAAHHALLAPDAPPFVQFLLGGLRVPVA